MPKIKVRANSGFFLLDAAGTGQVTRGSELTVDGDDDVVRNNIHFGRLSVIEEVKEKKAAPKKVEEETPAQEVKVEPAEAKSDSASSDGGSGTDKGSDSKSGRTTAKKDSDAK